MYIYVIEHYKIQNILFYIILRILLQQPFLAEVCIEKVIIPQYLKYTQTIEHTFGFLSVNLFQQLKEIFQLCASDIRTAITGQFTAKKSRKRNENKNKKDIDSNITIFKNILKDYRYLWYSRLNDQIYHRYNNTVNNNDDDCDTSVILHTSKSSSWKSYDSLFRSEPHMNEPSTDDDNIE